jgi:hypothetical protein
MTLQIKKNRRSSESKQAAIAEATRESVARLNALIPESLHRRLKMQAIAEGRGATVTSIIITATDEYLRRYADEAMRR